MINRIMKIYELFDAKYNWSWVRRSTDTWVANFMTETEDSVMVEFAKNINTWMIEFDRNGQLGRTGRGDQFKIFSTVGDILKDFIEQVDPKAFLFTSYKDKKVNPKAKELGVQGMQDLMAKTGEIIPYHIDNDSRTKLYKQIAKKLSKTYGYKVEITDLPDSSFFMFSK